MPGPVDESQVDVSIVVPVYHNAPTLEELHRRIVAVLEARGVSFEILCIDDGSRDDSWEVLQRLHRSDPRLRPLRLSRNFGQVPALCAGLEHMRGSLGVTLDADLQNPPEDLPAFLDALDAGHDLVSGVRMERGDSMVARRLPSRIFNRLVVAMVGIPLRDWGCGMNGFSRRLAREINKYGGMRRFLKPLAAGLASRITEVPVHYLPSTPGGSRYDFMRLVGVQLDFFTSYSRKPFQVILLAGLLLFGIGILGGFAIVASWLLLDRSTDDRLQVLAGIAMIFGLQLSVLGLLGEFIVRILHTLDRPFYVVRDDAD